MISTEYSEANSLVMFRDRGEAIWRCFVSNDGAERVAFASGATRAELAGSLLPQESRRYILGARNEKLWQSGDHIVEVYNMSNGAQTYNVIFGIE